MRRTGLIRRMTGGWPRTRRLRAGACLLPAGALAAAMLFAALSPPAAGLAMASPHPAPSAAPGKAVIPGPVTPGMRRTRTLPFTSLPRKIQAALRAAGVRSADVLIAEPNVLAYPSKCLDANNAGPAAGQNGDKVQLWDCLDDAIGSPNQWWIPVQRTSGWTELMNLQYANMCLDADSSHGFVDGAKVQLWHCYNDPRNRPNQWWNWGPNGDYSRLPNMWLPSGQPSKALDANDTGPTAGQNGDKVQIWTIPGNGSNQEWWQNATVN